SWPLPALAPALGLIGIAGMWPALAAGAATAWRRAALAASGWIWLVLAAPLAGRDLYARRPSGTPDPSTWIASPYQATHHVLAPAVTSRLSRVRNAANVRAGLP